MRLELRRYVCTGVGVLCTLLHAHAQKVLTNAARASIGYTLISPINSATSYLIDNDGAVVHHWLGNGGTAQSVYLLPNGHLLRTGIATSSALGATVGSGGRIDEFTWDGMLVWSYTLANEKYLRHHDIAALPNGNVLIEAWELHTRDEAIAAGRAPERISGATFYSEAIFEIQPIRPLGGEVVWEWHVWDHLVQDFDSSKQNFGDVSANPGLMDINFGTATPDWLHFNAIAYNADLDQIVVSSVTLSEIWIIDHGTTSMEAATHGGGKRGKGGDILYRWGNPQTYRAGAAAEQRLFNQHGVHWIPSDLPGAGHLLLFNNGGGRGFSTADEIVPPLDEGGTYARFESRRFGPGKPVWSYGEGAQPHFFSSIFGGAQRLPNGNTLICVSTMFRIIEVTPEGEVVWDTSIQDLAGLNGGGSFRAPRYPPSFDGLRGTDLFREAPALVNAASLHGGPAAAGAVVEGRGVHLPATRVGSVVEITDGSDRRFLATLIAASGNAVFFQVPSAAATGPARATISGTEVAGQVAEFRIEAVAPGLFSANGDGQGVGAVEVVRVNGTGQSSELAFSYDVAIGRFVPKPIFLGGPDERIYVHLYGTGIRNFSERPTVWIGGLRVPVIATGIESLLPGMDEVMAGPVPRDLAGTGLQPISLTVDGRASNSVRIFFQ